MKYTSMTTLATTLALIATSFAVMQQIQAQDGDSIITYLSGKEEVPPNVSNASAGPSSSC
jgi:hypothetical protein